MNVRQIIVGFLLFSATYSTLLGQGKFVCTLSSDSLSAGNYIRVSYLIENVEGKLEIPSFSDFEVVSGPNTSSQMSMINGVVSKRMKYDYIIYIDKPGDFYLNSAYLVSKDKTYEIQPIRIVVDVNKSLNPKPSIDERRPYTYVLEIDENGESINRGDSSKKKRVLKRI